MEEKQIQAKPVKHQQSRAKQSEEQDSHKYQPSHQQA
jgi:hypothetical protein